MIRVQWHPALITTDHRQHTTAPAHPIIATLFDLGIVLRTEAAEIPWAISRRETVHTLGWCLHTCGHCLKSEILGLREYDEERQCLIAFQGFKTLGFERLKDGRFRDIETRV